MHLKTSPGNARQAVGTSTILTLFALVALAALLVAGPLGTASAAGPQGSAKFKFSYGKAGKALNKQGVKISALSQAKAKYKKGRRLNVTAKVAAVSIGSGPAAKVRLDGGMKFSKGKRSVRMKGLILKADDDDVKINAKVGGKTRTVFLAKGSNAIDPATGSVKVGSAKLTLSKGISRTIRKRLRLKRLPAARVGSISATAQAAFEDPYIDSCAISATTRSVGSVPEAVTPSLSGAVATIGEPVSWGFKASFNGYVNGVGNIQVLDGASKVLLPFPGPPPVSFDYLFEEGSYAANEAGTTDDQAILNGTGSVLYCNEPHGFRIVISNPTVVIDGDESRLIADVDTNISGDWRPTQRVGLADLNLASAVVTEPGAGTVEWADIPATLSETGSEALRLCEISAPGAPPGCVYPVGTQLDALTVTATTAIP